MQLIATRLGRLNVDVDGSGPPAVLWHSLFVDSTSWDRLRRQLATRRTLILVDGPGHGRSQPPPGPFDVADCAAAADEILDALAMPRPVDWLGNAWGGHVGVQFAASQPQACRSLITVASPIRSLTSGERRLVLLVHYVHRVTGPRLLASPVTDELLGRKLRRSDPEAAAAVRAAFTGADRSGMSEAIRSISLNRADATDHLTAIKAPTLMVAGADHTMCSPADTASWAAQVPQGRSRTVDGSGPLAPLFDTRTATLITDFWSESSPP